MFNNSNYGWTMLGASLPVRRIFAGYIQSLEYYFPKHQDQLDHRKTDRNHAGCDKRNNYPLGHPKRRTLLKTTTL